MIRDVDLVSYLPPFIEKYKETNIALEAENPEFILIWKAVDRALKNEFIATADEYGISKFEKILDLHPKDTDPLDSRRMRVQNRWFNALPYTIRVLASKLAECLGGEYNFSIEADFGNTYKMTVIIYSSDDSQDEEVKYLLSMMVPVNIFPEIVYESVTSMTDLHCGAVLEQADIIELRQRRG